MTVAGTRKPRRTFRWSKEARDLVRSNLDAHGWQLTELVTRLTQLSGNPRDACQRFARQLGLHAKRDHREWTEQERQSLLRLINLHPVLEIATLMRRSKFSIYQMLLHMGANPTTRKDGFTKYSLAALLHIRAEEIQRWIDKGWLRARVEGTEKMPRTVITASAFTTFCKRHRKAVIGNRLNSARMEFVRTFVFAPSHAELLPVRDAKKEQAAYDVQMHGTSDEDEDLEFQDFKEDGTAVGLSA